MPSLVGSEMCIRDSAWAGPDCGNPPTKTAEVVYSIATPQQVFAPQAAAAAPAIAPVRVQPIAAQPAQQVTPQAAPQAYVAPEPVKTAQVAAPQVNGPTAAYAAILERRISRGAGGLNLFDYAGAKAAGEGRAIKAYTCLLYTSPSPRD